jgi:enamine deaminase RidA (YjgF/YER057c/UK114 family)
MNKRYRLKREMPELPAGVIFEHRDYDPKFPDRGNRGCGCMILAWGPNGNCQAGWCGETFIMPGQLADDRDWFEPVDGTQKLVEALAEIKKILEKTDLNAFQTP